MAFNSELFEYREIRPRIKWQYRKGDIAWNKGKKLSDTHSEESVKKILSSLQRNGRKDFGGHNKKKVVMINPDNNKIVGAFEIASEAERKTGIEKRNILRSCSGKYKAGGFFWKKEEDL